jgi:hypothetical protein
VLAVPLTHPALAPDPPIYSLFLVENSSVSRLFYECDRVGHRQLPQGGVRDCQQLTHSQTVAERSSDEFSTAAFVA